MGSCPASLPSARGKRKDHRAGGSARDGVASRVSGDYGQKRISGWLPRLSILAAKDRSIFAFLRTLASGAGAPPPSVLLPAGTVVQDCHPGVDALVGVGRPLEA